MIRSSKRVKSSSKYQQDIHTVTPQNNPQNDDSVKVEPKSTFSSFSSVQMGNGHRGFTPVVPSSSAVIEDNKGTKRKSLFVDIDLGDLQVQDLPSFSFTSTIHKPSSSTVNESKTSETNMEDKTGIDLRKFNDTFDYENMSDWDLDEIKEEVEPKFTLKNKKPRNLIEDRASVKKAEKSEGHLKNSDDFSHLLNDDFEWSDLTSVKSQLKGFMIAGQEVKLSEEQMQRGFNRFKDIEELFFKEMAAYLWSQQKGSD